MAAKKFDESDLDELVLAEADSEIRGRFDGVDAIAAVDPLHEMGASRIVR